jgi:hypothetical protein
MNTHWINHVRLAVLLFPKTQLPSPWENLTNLTKLTEAWGVGLAEGTSCFR